MAPEGRGRGGRKNIVKCSVCGKVTIQEEFEHHRCAKKTNRFKEIHVDFWWSHKTPNERETFNAHGLDGTLYKIVLEPKSKRKAIEYNHEKLASSTESLQRKKGEDSDESTGDLPAPFR